MSGSVVRMLAGAAVLAASAGALTVGDAAAQGRIACGEDLYRVRPGDSLSEIAQRAYASFNYQVIFDANRDVLANPAVLLVGQRLFIPCLDGSGPASKAEALGRPVPAAAAEAEPEALEADSGPGAEEEDVPVASRGQAAGAAPPVDRTVRFLTGSNFAPFTGRDLPAGGMLTDVVNRAMLRADALRPYDITWVNDWSRHLSELLPEGEHDLGFPWYRPDCSLIEKLSEAMQMRCTDYDFSQPLYEVAVGYYLPAGAPERTATEHSALFGKRLCRPSGYFTFDLEEVGLVEPNIEMVMPPDPGECFEMLARGEVDFVSVNVFLAEREIAELGLGEEVTDAPGLASVETLHVVAPKSNPYGRAYLQLVDRGLRQLREEGVWFEITSRHLAEHARNL